MIPYRKNSNGPAILNEGPTQKMKRYKGQPAKSRTDQYLNEGNTKTIMRSWPCPEIVDT